MRRKLVRADFERMHLPEEYWRTKVSGVPESVRTAVVRYLLKIDEMCLEGIGLLLVGASGVGKSGVASLVLKEARAHGHTGWFGSVWELREMIRSRVPFADDLTMLQRARNVDVLVLDDLRPDDVTQGWFGRSEIEALVAARAASRLVTVITSRMKPAVLYRELPSLMDSVQGCMVDMAIVGANLREARQEELRRAVYGD